MALSKILCKSKTKQAKGQLARASIIWDSLLAAILPHSKNTSFQVFSLL